MARAVGLLDHIGATAVFPRARARLRALGVASVPRGRTASTRRNPAGLTDRQLEVLELVGAGLTLLSQGIASAARSGVKTSKRALRKASPLTH